MRSQSKIAKKSVTVSKILTLFLFLFSSPSFAETCGSLFSDSYFWWKAIERDVISDFKEEVSFGYGGKASHFKTLRNSLKVSEDSKFNLETIFKNYDTTISEIQKLKGLENSDVIRPALVFKLENGELAWFSYGQEIPFEIREQISYYYNGILSPKIYWQMIGEGYFPMGGNRRREVVGSIFSHDLNHLTGFIEHPEYMSLMRKMAKIFLSRGIPVNKGEDPFFAQAVPSYFFSEGITLPIEEKKQDLLKVLILPTKTKIFSLTLKEVEDHLKSVSNDSLLQVVSDLLKNYDQFFTSCGGGARDVRHRDNSNHDPIYALLKFIKSDSEPNHPTWYRREFGTHLEMVNAVARIQLAIVKLTNLNVQNWFNETINPGSDDKINDYLRASGIFSGVEGFETFRDIFQD